MPKSVSYLCFSLVAIFIPKFFSLAFGPSAFLCKVNSLQLMKLVFCRPIITCILILMDFILLLILMDFILNCVSTLLKCYVLLGLLVLHCNPLLLHCIGKISYQSSLYCGPFVWFVNILFVWAWLVWHCILFFFSPLLYASLVFIWVSTVQTKLCQNWVQWCMIRSHNLSNHQQ